MNHLEKGPPAIDNYPEKIQRPGWNPVLRDGRCAMAVLGLKA